MKIKQFNAFLGISLTSSLRFPLLFSLFLPLFFTVSACKVKEGCPGMNQHEPVGKGGKLSTKGGRSGLFPQGMRH